MQAMGSSVSAGVMVALFDRPWYNPGLSENSWCFYNGFFTTENHLLIGFNLDSYLKMLPL